MLFNSYGFLFLYLPIVLLGFFQLGRISHAYAAGWLALSSLFFYGYWNLAYIGLLLGSIACNYAFGLWIAKAGVRHDKGRKKHLLIVAITSNLLLLGYYKYANFFLSNINAIAETHLTLGEIILPLGISFFTFTQISFLVDTYQGKVKEYNFIHYALFVTYFPHLIAGPVLHHKDMMPQFAHASTYRFNYENMAVGLTIFFIGLFKKVILADGIAEYVSPVFNAPAAGIQLTFIEAWGGALCYTLQLYFDFSGYSDMAIGLSRMFGVILPLNFHSPYKSMNIIDFWQRWHISLTKYIREYLYTPITLSFTRLGFGKPAPIEVLYSLVIPTMAIFLILGLWHGANWTYVIFGGMHGLLIVINHLWRKRGFLLTDKKTPPGALARTTGWAMTFFSVSLTFVMFRADSIATAISIYKGALGFNGFVMPDAWMFKWGVFGQWLAEHGMTFGATNGLIGGGAINWIWILMLIVLLAPNTQQIMQHFKPALGVPTMAPTRLTWQPTIKAAILVWLLGFIAVINLNKQSVFLYFQF
jgi:D-alanyl-lipoteichoic acid acyltransferase DltB (MBOAT superfamily)